MSSNDTNPSFDFKRLGVRIPVVLVSPYVAKQTIAPRPEYNESQYSHSSFIHTLREQFIPQCPPLSERDAWSKTFEDILSLDTPRYNFAFF